jgi:FMN phosphatase YigB (HAD superfamily)
MAAEHRRILSPSEENRPVIDVALVDFGNTLADETFMRRDGDQFPTWTTDYVAVVDELRHQWDTGRLSSHQIAQRVADRLAASPEAVHRHMLDLCCSLTFYPAINEALRRRRARGGRQALVTVNPDLFRNIARIHALHDWFDVIVASWEHGSDDKTELCHRALELLGNVEPDRTILIDNLSGHIDAWMRSGGHGYVFRDDATFVDDVLHQRVPGFLAADVAPTNPQPALRRVPRASDLVEQVHEGPRLDTQAQQGNTGAATPPSEPAGD